MERYFVRLCTYASFFVKHQQRSCTAPQATPSNPQQVSDAYLFSNLLYAFSFFLRRNIGNRYLQLDLHLLFHFFPSSPSIACNETVVIAFLPLPREWNSLAIVQVGASDIPCRGRRKEQQRSEVCCSSARTVRFSWFAFFSLPPAPSLGQTDPHSGRFGRGAGSISTTCDATEPNDCCLFA